MGNLVFVLEERLGDSIYRILVKVRAAGERCKYGDGGYAGDAFISGIFNRVRRIEGVLGDERICRGAFNGNQNDLYHGIKLKYGRVRYARSHECGVDGHLLDSSGRIAETEVFDLAEVVISEAVGFKYLAGICFCAGTDVADGNAYQQDPQCW